MLSDAPIYILWAGGFCLVALLADWTVRECRAGTLRTRLREARQAAKDFFAADRDTQRSRD